MSGSSANYEYNEWICDSDEYTQGNNNQPVFFLAHPIRHVRGFKVLDVSVPYTFYSVRHDNNHFYLCEDLVNNTYISVYLTPGNYDADSICEELENKLENAGAGTYIVAYDSSTGKITIRRDGFLNFALIFGSLPCPATLLGFQADTRYDSTSYTISAPNLVQLQGPSSIYLCSRRLGLLSASSLRRSAASQSGAIIAKIPILTNFGGTIHWLDGDSAHYFTTMSRTIDEIDLYLSVDASLTPLDLNGAAFSVRIGFMIEPEGGEEGINGGMRRFITMGTGGS